MSSSQKHHIDFLEFARGLFEKAVGMLEPVNLDDFSIISGSILLIVGLEKLVKGVIYAKNPLMVLLDKITFKVLVDDGNGESFANYKTISFDEALGRVVDLYPALKAHQSKIKKIIDDRNLLIHNFGALDIVRLEKDIQVTVYDFTKALCLHCLNRPPQDVIGQQTWNLLESTRNGYINSQTLDLNNRIAYLKRRLAQRQSLDCQAIDIQELWHGLEFCCPVCEDEATVYFDIDWDVSDFDHREGAVLVSPYPSPVALSCQCGFTLSTGNEVSILLGDNEDSLCERIADDIGSGIEYAHATPV
jgi:hypothetical protein